MGCHTDDADQDRLVGIVQERCDVALPFMRPKANRLVWAARQETNVWISGGHGAERIIVARLIHEISTRKDDPFLIVPCRWAPCDVFSVRGKLEAARNGTALLNDIDALGWDQQQALLQLLEGAADHANGEPSGFSGRIIASSARDVIDSVESGTFDARLYYRLNVWSFRLPSFGERVERQSQDLPELEFELGRTH